MPLHPLAVQFAEVADAYERGRPEYAPAVVGAIAAELRIPAAGPVLDLAAGTGKLTRALLTAGLDVVAVEPQPSLRAVLTASVGSERVRPGLAEAIPLPDASVVAVTVADAFHWFDHALALGEIRRVLRPGGGLAVLSTVPDWGGASWAHEVVDYLGSVSWIAALPANQRDEVLAKLAAIVSAGETPAQLPLHVIIRLTAPASP